MTEREHEQLDNARRLGTFLVNTLAGDRQELERRHGQVWDTEELGRDFEVEGFLAPFVVVKRRVDGKVGSLFFQHHPRLYFGWQEDDTEAGRRIGQRMSEGGEDNNLQDEAAKKEKEQ